MDMVREGEAGAEDARREDRGGLTLRRGALVAVHRFSCPLHRRGLSSVVLAGQVANNVRRGSFFSPGPPVTPSPGHPPFVCGGQVLRLHPPPCTANSTAVTGNLAIRNCLRSVHVQLYPCGQRREGNQDLSLLRIPLSVRCSHGFAWEGHRVHRRANSRAPQTLHLKQKSVSVVGGTDPTAQPRHRAVLVRPQVIVPFGERQ